MEIWDEVVKQYNNELVRLKNLVSEGDNVLPSVYEPLI